jgi:hypothetical protein
VFPYEEQPYSDIISLEMVSIRDALDTDFAGYRISGEVGYRISGSFF